MTAQELKNICQADQYAAIHRLYHHTPKRGGAVDCVDKTLDEISSLVKTIDLDTVGGMMRVLTSAKEDQLALAQGMLVLVRVLKRIGCSFEDCLLMTAWSFASEEAVDRATMVMMAIGKQARALSSETTQKMNGASHQHQR